MKLCVKFMGDWFYFCEGLLVVVCCFIVCFLFVCLVFGCGFGGFSFVMVLCRFLVCSMCFF